MMKKILIVTIGMLAGLAFAAEAATVKFEVSIDREQVALGESAQLGLTFRGTQSMPAPDVGKIDGLEVRYIGPSTMMTVINGTVSSSVTHMYTVQPLKIGKFQIGPFSFSFKGNTYTSGVAFIEAVEDRRQTTRATPVQAPGTVPVMAEKIDLGDRIFLTLEATRTRAYVNELIPVTVKLYVNRMNVSDIQLPTFSQEGFSKVAFKDPKQYRERDGAAVYDVLEFNTSIFGTKPGDFTLGPAQIKCNAMIRKNTRGMRDDFFRDSYNDDFFDDFFTRFEKHPLELRSKEVKITVLPLPEAGRPKDFTGAIGDYQFIFDVNPRKVKVGDPVTVDMTINGRGNFNTVIMPRFETTDGFRVYEPQIKTEDNRKIFKQVLIPESEKITMVPAATFSYFDPYKETYKTIVQGKIPLLVEKGKEESQAQVIGAPPAVPEPGSPEKEDLGRDLIYIKESPGDLVRTGSAFYRSRAFWPVAVMPLAVLAVFTVVMVRRNRLKSDALYAGHVFAIRAMRRGMRELRGAAKKKDVSRFYDALFKALQGYLGNRLAMSPDGITGNVVIEALAMKNVEPDILRKIGNLFEACDRTKFAFENVPEHAMEDNMKEFAEVVAYLERLKI